ncbi:MAG: hydantoinase/oxoprolinase family protein [Chloroflexota bacterium]
MRFRVGIDIGGTFSDLVVVAQDGRVLTLKVSSAADQVVSALVGGLATLLAGGGFRAGDADAVVHGTTAATNAILEYKGARTGLVTTRGFRDVLEIRRLRVGRLYDLGWTKPQPLVLRRHRFEVDERLDVNGGVVRSLDEASVRDAVDALVDSGVDAVAVSLIHAYANPTHERRVAELIRERLPHTHLSISSEVLPEMGEYERTSTTAINAYIGPVVDRYLGALERGLQESGVTSPLLVMQSNGGVMRATTARQRPVHIVESGPAGGVVAALRLATQIGEPNVITVDMGGTTAKASILEDGRAFQMAEYEVGAGISAGSRMFKGGGHLLRVPALDIAEVGAGGGSIVRVDSGGGLRVGPDSAGANPGPVCYGLGNLQPTLTDANLCLGYLNQTHLLGGTLAIDGEAARRELTDRVARPLGLDLQRAAYGVHQVAVSNMVRVARAVSTERGRDPRRCVLMAFGGNGPVHAVEVARQLGIGRVIVPPWPGLFSAFGLLFAEPRHELVQALRRALGTRGADEIVRGLDALESTAVATLRDEGYAAESVVVQRVLDLRYRGQATELRIAAGERIAVEDLERIAADFEAEHLRVYGHHDSRDRIELVNLRLIARAAIEMPSVRHELASAGRSADRSAYFGPAIGALPTPVVGRGDIGLGASAGPLIVEEYDATTVVPPGWTVRRDDHANLILEQP